MTSQRIVLITGCSSGIGAALAEEFLVRGHRVFATARRLESLKSLTDKGARALRLDVNDSGSVEKAFAAVASQCGKLDMLINNAGFGQFGAVIDMEPKDLRHQFDTNVFAPVALTRAALPLLRKSSDARIVNVGSISGIVTTPFAGAYCASKAALHALSDAMRMELAPLGLRVITLQPGGVVSKIGVNGEANVRLTEDSLYRSIASFIRGRAVASQLGATPADVFAREVVKGLTAAHPPAELRLGAQSTRLPLLKRFVPTAVLDRKLSKMFGLSEL